MPDAPARFHGCLLVATCDSDMAHCTCQQEHACEPGHMVGNLCNASRAGLQKHDLFCHMRARMLSTHEKMPY